MLNISHVTDALWELIIFQIIFTPKKLSPLKFSAVRLNGRQTETFPDFQMFL